MKFTTTLIIVYLFVELCVGGDDDWEITAEIRCPVGVISMFYGDCMRIPKGYQICDGKHGTPNLISKFIVGADPALAKYPPAELPFPPPYKVGTIGGYNQNVLTTLNLPAHKHAIDPSSATTTSYMNFIDGLHDTHTFDLNANTFNSDHKHGINFNSQDETQHTHTVPEHTTGDGKHDHFIPAYQEDVNAPGFTNGIPFESIGGVNAHMVLTESVNNTDGAHLHIIPSITTDIATAGHSHQIVGDTEIDGTHDHIVDGNIDDGRHSHFITGWTENTGQIIPNPIDNRPHFSAVYYICCVGNYKDIEPITHSGKD